MNKRKLALKQLLDIGSDVTALIAKGLARPNKQMTSAEHKKADGLMKKAQTVLKQMKKEELVAEKDDLT